MILAIRTDRPVAEIGLYEKGRQLAYREWQAHRELSATIHVVIKELLESVGKDWNDISGIIFYKGPGSFTGLRIGASVANAIAASNHAPVTNQSGTDWVGDGLTALNEVAEGLALPDYGSEPHTTTPRK